MKQFFKRFIPICIVICVLCGGFLWLGQGDGQESDLVTYIAEAEKIVDGVTRQKNLYDERGNLTDIIEYYDNGDESSREYWRYSRTDKVLEAGVYKNGELSYKDVYTYDENDRLIEKWRYNKDGSENLTVKNTYDERGNCVEKQEQNCRKVYEYNDLNQLVGFSEYIGDSKHRRTVYERDSEGRIKKWENFVNGVCEGYGFYEYDRNGNKTKLSAFKNGQLETEFEYDLNGNNTKQSTFKNGRLETEFEYTYNDLGKLTESKQYSSGGTTVRREYRYNDDGKEVYYAKFENDIETERREKVFDANGCQIESQEYTNGIIVRGITCEFSENNECKKKVEIWYKDGKEDYRYTYTYNEKGDQLTYTYNKKASGYTSHAERVYNKSGLLEKIISKEDSKAAAVSSEYKYDKSGNLLKAIYYYGGSYEERTFNYDPDGNKTEYMQRTPDGKVYVTKYIPLKISQKKTKDIKTKLSREIIQY